MKSTSLLRCATLLPALAASAMPSPALAAPAWADVPMAIRVHIVAALIAVAAGLIILAVRRGTATHRALGRVYAGAMLLVAIGSFSIRTSGGLSWIHALSAFTLLSLAAAWLAIRRLPPARRVRTHAGFMIGTYVGLLIAGAFTLMPQRIIGQWVLAAVG